MRRRHRPPPRRLRRPSPAFHSHLLVPGDLVMDSDAAVPQAKKMRTEAAERQQEPEEILRTASPAAVGAPLSEPTPHGQEPSAVAGGKERDSVDRISSLPDAVLGEIISLLPTKDGVRTQSLASRWRHLWLSAPLNLDHSGLPNDVEVQAGIITRILAAHPGPGRRLSVPLRHRPPTVDAWLLSSALDNLQEIEFVNGKLPYGFLRGQYISLPASAFRFSATLRVATFSNCDILDQTVETLLFPQLRQLAFDSVTISSVSLHSMITRCPVLECLLLDGVIYFDCLRINSLSLRSIGMSYGELVIEDAPLLERLFQVEPHYEIRISVISAPKLETLGCFLGIGVSNKLVSGTTVIRDLRAGGITAVVSSIKILAIGIYDLSIDLVIDLLRCFPCMEKLYIQSCVSGNKNLWRRKHGILLRSLDIRLETVVLKNYRGTKSQVNFATFFVLNAKRLELMRFEGGIKNGHEIDIAEQRRLLQLEKRASRGARFYFTTGRGCQRGLAHVRHVRDLSATDPFECTC